MARQPSGWVAWTALTRAWPGVMAERKRLSEFHVKRATR